MKRRNDPAAMTSWRSAFTILEVLLALTASLFIMLAATRVLKSLGDRINVSQSEIGLQRELRDVAIQLRNDLANATYAIALDNGDESNAVSNNAASGYVTYHEGHMTENTTTHVQLATIDAGVAPSGDFFPTNRFGDLDDYLAFTARVNSADGDEPFLGYIPRGVLAAHAYIDLFDKYNRAPTAAEMEALYGAPYTAAASVELVPFFSDQAEIVYFTSPGWNDVPLDVGDTNYDAANDPTNGRLTYRDANGDLLPDRVRLHRRTLLIRDDLNLTLDNMEAHGSPITINGNPPGTTSTLPFLSVEGGTPVLRPFSSRVGNQGFAAPFAYNLNVWTGNQANEFLWAPGVWNAGVTNNSPNWLTGVARVQQVMDLSLSRITNDWATPATTGAPAVTEQSYGMPSRFLRCNSLDNLRRPENRFAYVRMPTAPLLRVATGNAAFANGSTMPMLALGPPIPYLTDAERIHDPNNPARPYMPFNGTVLRNLPSQADPDGISGAATAGPFLTPAQRASAPDPDRLAFLTAVNRYGKHTLTGFLRPEFALPDVAFGPQINPTQARVAYEINRSRTDVIVSDVLAFDVKMFVSDRPGYTWLGGDGVEGSPGDDDGDGSASDVDMVFDTEEVGFASSDDEIVPLDFLNVRQAVASAGTGPATGSNPFAFQLTPEGGFIDLNYLRLAGHPIGGIADPGIGRVDLFNAGLLGNAGGFTDGRTPFGIGLDAPGGNVKTIPLDFQRAGLVTLRTSNAFDNVSSFMQNRYETRQPYSGDGFDQESTRTLINGTYTLQYGVASTNTTAQPPAVVDLASSDRIWTSFAETGGSASPAFNGPGAIDIPGGAEQSPPVVTAPGGFEIRLRFYDRSQARIRQQAVVVPF